MNIILTERLLLRKPKIIDAENIFDTYAQDEEVVKYLTWKVHSNIKETEDFLCTVLKRIEKEGDLIYVVEEIHTKKLIGMIDMRIKGNNAEMGYVLAKKYWGKGIMTEAVISLVNFIFEKNFIKRIEAFCDIDNLGSKRVLEKSGFNLVEVKKNFIRHPNISVKSRDCYLFAIDSSR